MKKAPWSKDRPVKPDVDPLYLQVVKLLGQDARSTYAQANVSGLSTATINNWTKHKVKRPQSVSLQMAAKMLGYRITLTPEPNKATQGLPKVRARA